MEKLALNDDSKSVTREDLDTSEERKQFTEDNPDKAVVTRKDGSVQVIDKDTGTVEKGFTKEGKQQVSITISKGGGGGRKTTQKDLTQEKREEVTRAAAGETEPLTGTAKDARDYALREQEKALREGNFSGADGTISRIDYVDESQQSQATRADLERARNPGPKPYEVLQVNEPTTRFQRFSQDLKYGFKVGSGLVYDPSTVGRVRSGNKAASFGEQAGFLAGSVAPFVAANQAPRVAQLATRAEAAVASTRAARVVQSTRVGRFATGLATGVAESVAIVEVGETIGTADLTPAQRQLLKDPIVKQAVAQGRQAEIQAVKESGSSINVFGREVGVNPRRLGFELIGTKLSGKRGEEAFTQAVEANLARSNLTGYQQDLALKAAVDQKRAVDTSELGALLNIARYSEGFGRREVNRIFQDVPVTGNIGLKTALITAPSIGTAGFIEGFSQEITQQKVRSQPLNVQQAASMGGFGAVSAATLGGVIAGGGVVKSKAARAVELGTYVTDPFEKPGDLFQDVVEGAVSRARAPVIANEPIFLGDRNQLIRDINPKISQVETLPRTPGVIKGPTESILTTSFNVPVNLRVPTPIDVFSNVNAPTGTPVPVPAAINTNIPVPVPVPTNTNVNIPANIFTNVGVPVPVPTSTQTPVPVPIVVPEQGFFPFIPQKPAGGPGGSGYGKRGRKRKTRPTSSIAQQFFNIPDTFVFKQKGLSEETGLFLRGL